MLDLTDRKNCFYWQTDRSLSAEDYARIFLKRHEVPQSELVRVLNNGISSIKNIESINIFLPDENVTRGNVNIVRKVTINGLLYIVRIHPKGVKNGYFYVEKVAHHLAKKNRLPVAEILEVHEAKDENDMDFVLIEALPGMTMDNYFKKNSSNEESLLHNAGKLMAKIHEIKIKKYGSFSNTIAKNKDELVGLHENYHDFIWTGLEENLERLIRFKTITNSQAEAMKMIFKKNNFEPIDGPRLIHNDFADWNLLTDGKQITGILDWDECHGGDPIADLACWSTFFNLERFTPFLSGYKSNSSLPGDFDNRFHFYRLRYTISKMALRVKRYQVDKDESVRDRIEVGKKAMTEESNWFKIRV